MNDPGPRSVHLFSVLLFRECLRYSREVFVKGETVSYAGLPELSRIDHGSKPLSDESSRKIEKPGKCGEKLGKKGYSINTPSTRNDGEMIIFSWCNLKS